MTPKEQFINAYSQEHATTMRVLRAFPEGKAEIKPHAKLRSARDLAWVFVAEQGMCQISLTTGFDWSKPAAMPPAPATLAEIIAAFDLGRQQLVDSVSRRDDNLTGTVKFFVAPRTLGDMSLNQFLWMTLCDQIHHRGQFSVYLRMADGIVPSIYGPTAEDHWM